MLRSHHPIDINCIFLRKLCVAKYVDPKIVPEKKAVDLIAKPSSELLEEGRSPVLNASADRSANTTGLRACWKDRSRQNQRTYVL